MDIRLKEILHNLKDYDFDILGSYRLDANEAQKLISALEELENGGWILCSERLPEEDGYYLVSYEGSVTMMQFLTSCNHFGWIRDHRWYSETGKALVAWQQLPDHLKERES